MKYIFSESAKLLFAIDQFGKMKGHHSNLFEKSLTLEELPCHAI